MNDFPALPPTLFVEAVEQSHDGITISDANNHFQVVYVNQGFQTLTGYSSAEMLEHGYRILQGDDTEQPELTTLRNAIINGETCVVTLRNYRKDGSMFWNELSVSPVRDAEGKLTHYIAIQKDATARVLLERYLHQSNLDLRLLNQQMEKKEHIDPLVGLSTFRHFNEMFATLLHGSLRTHSDLAVLIIEISHFKPFNERYGVQAGDECLRMVGEAIAMAYTRHSDCASRYAEERFMVISLGGNAEEVRRHAEKLCAKVRTLGIPHSDSPFGVVTISIGGIVCTPNRESQSDDLIKQAEVVLSMMVKRDEYEQVRIMNL
ncbi:MAG: diguanylate cyclase [Gallionella sp.]|nr:diguanylate cyclase [Gallionella sp.]